MTRFFLGKGLRINGAMQLILQGGRPDIICDLQGGSRSGFTALLLSQLYDIPFVVWERKTGFQRDHITGIALERRRRILQQASEVAAVSPQLADSIRQSMDLPDLKVNTIPNLIPEVVPQPCGRSGKYSGLTGGSFVFAAWTNWRSFKRMDLLLTSFAQVVEKGYDARLLIAGSGEEARRLASGRERVDWLGQLDRNGIISLADACDCCVIPSDVETFGLPAIEAMACGRPVVATICGGPESIITHPGLGRTVPAGNAGALADAMIDVIENRHTFVSADIRRHFDETYSPEALRKDWQSVLSRVAGPIVH